MEFPLESIKKELLRLKKTELVQFIIWRRLPVKFKKITVVIDFLLANESKWCRCSNGDVAPITFYNPEKAADDSQNLIETDYGITKPTCIWINPESTITETSYMSNASTNESTVSEINFKSTAAHNEPSFKLPEALNKPPAYQSSLLRTALLNNVQDSNLEAGISEEHLDLDAASIKMEYPEFKEEKFSISFDECKPFIENGQLENVDEAEVVSDEKIREMFKCEICNYETCYKKFFVKHQISHSEARPFACDLCTYKAKSKRQLKDHVGRHNSFKKLLCDLCDYKCSNKYILKGHMLTHTREVEFACSLCDYKTFQERLFKWHMKTHNDTTSFQCEICGNIFKKKSYLIKHVLQYHTRDKPFKCESCNYTCVGRSLLKKHERSVHLREKKFSCEFCDYKCFGSNSLTTHRRFHTGEKPFECDRCDYKSAIKGMLKVHMRTHTGERPFGCEFCGYRAAVKPNLRLHVQRMHSDKM